MIAEPSSARLRAIIALDPKQAVRCQQPGCHHRVYAAVHIVQESGGYLVLGSTCFAKRYGGTKALGEATYGSGSGRSLTDEERQTLLANTAALIARFEEEDRAREAAELEAERRRTEQRALIDRAREQEEELGWERLGRPVPPRVNPYTARRSDSPWPWQSTRFTSIAVLSAPDGRTWVRVQHQDDSQKLVPWPVFPGWENALPAEVGVPDAQITGYAVKDIVEALRLLRALGFVGPRVGSWREVLPLRR